MGADVSVGWLEHEAELFHAWAFLCGLRFRHAREKAESIRKSWWKRVVLDLGDIAEMWSRAAQRELESMHRFSTIAAQYETKAQKILDRGGVR